MKVKIKRIDKSQPLPEYHSPGAVAFDLSAREDILIPANKMARIPLNVVVEIPKGYMLLLKDRSSTLKKTGLLTTVGYIDQDFNGPEDEMLLQVYNPTREDITVKRGDRLAQASFVQVGIAQWDETDSDMKEDSRGGFGSTGI